MFFNNEINYLPFNNLSNIYVVADFDKTLTKGSSESSWSVFAHSGILPEAYTKERKTLFNYYRPIEIDESFDEDKKAELMSEWTFKLLNLFHKYNLTESDFNDIIQNTKVLEIRDGVVEFLDFLHKNNIPLIIVSAGVGNVIEKFLEKNNCLFDNIFIASNFIQFNNGKFDKVNDKIIHSLNKNEIIYPSHILEKIEDRKNVILIGDQTSDKNMVDEINHNITLKIGLYIDEETTTLQSLKNVYDIVLDSNENYYELLKILFNK